MTTLIIKEFSGPFYFLSNFFVSPVSFLAGGRNVTFATAEHAFQASKYVCISGDKHAKQEYVLSIEDSIDPAEAKRLGREAKIDLDKWENIKINNMRQIVWNKFEQNKELRVCLMSTDSAMLVEGNTWGDTFWGRSGGKGYNMLGVILMEVRGYYRLTPPF